MHRIKECLAGPALCCGKTIPYLLKVRTFLFTLYFISMLYARLYCTPNFIVDLLKTGGAEGD